MAKETVDKSKDTKKDTIEVSKESLDKILSTLEEQKKQIDILTKASDKSRLEFAMSKETKPTGSVVKLSTYSFQGKDKIIIGWEMIKNDVYKDPITMAWRENQVIKFKFTDDTSAEVDYNNAMKGIVKIECNVLSRDKDINGHETFKVVTPSGEEIVIGSEFVN